MAYPISAFEDRKVELNSPAGSGYEITKSDLAVLDPPTRYIYVGGAGNLVVRLMPQEDGNQPTLTFMAVPVGTLLPIRAYQVMSATTATNLVGLY